MGQNRGKSVEINGYWIPRNLYVRGAHTHTPAHKPGGILKGGISRGINCFDGPCMQDKPAICRSCPYNEQVEK